MSRDPNRQTAEIHPRIAIMNRASALDRAASGAFCAPIGGGDMQHRLTPRRGGNITP